MSERTEWRQLRDQRMVEPGAGEAYEATRLEFELGKAAREMREQRGLDTDPTGSGCRHDQVGGSRCASCK